MSVVFKVYLVFLCATGLLHFRPALGVSRCPTPVCSGSRQVVAVCSVTDTTNVSNTFWRGTSIVGCAGGDFLTISHVVPNAMDSCAGTSFTASLVSVEGTVFTSELSMIPTPSNNEDTVGCYSPGLNDLVHQCTLSVPSVAVTGSLEQNGLSGVSVSINLMDPSGQVCVDQYFAVLSGNRVNSNNNNVVGPFPLNLCTTSNIPDVTVGTVRNGVDGPTATVSGFRANTRDLYFDLVASHTLDEMGLTFNLNWMVIDSTVMTQSNISCSCSPGTTVPSTTPTSGSIFVPYDQFNESSPQVNLSVYYQNGECYDSESITNYAVTNFVRATESAVNSQIITFDFNNTLLAPGVSVAVIRGSCRDGSQVVQLNYPPPNTYNLTATCNTGVYIFQALSSEGVPIGFPMSIKTIVPTLEPLSTGAVIALSVVLTFVFILVVGVSIGVLSVLVVNRCRRSEKENQTETEMRSPPPIYEEPDDVRHDPQTQENVAYGHVELRQ